MSESESSSATRAYNNQLSGGASAQNIDGVGGNVSIRNDAVDFGSVMVGRDVAMRGINAATDTAVSALFSNTATSQLALNNMKAAAESANLSSALASQAAANASMSSARLATEAAYGLSDKFISSASALTGSVLQKTQDQLSGVLNAVKSNNLAMVSSTEAANSTTQDMTKKILIGAGIIGAVLVLRG